MGTAGLIGGALTGLGAALTGVDRRGAHATRGNPGRIDAVRAAVSIVDQLYADKKGERLDRDTAMARIMREADSLQASINKMEATSRSLLVAGWRPFIGWICGVALCWHFLLQPIIIFFCEAAGLHGIAWPVFDLGTLDTILFGMLGLGTLRTAEKAAGKA